MHPRALCWELVEQNPAHCPHRLWKSGPWCSLRHAKYFWREKRSNVANLVILSFYSWKYMHKIYIFILYLEARLIFLSSLTNIFTSLPPLAQESPKTQDVCVLLLKTHGAAIWITSMPIKRAEQVEALLSLGTSSGHGKREPSFLERLL